MTTEKTPKIYAAMSKIMGDIGAITKARRSGGTGPSYQFRGIDDVYAAAQEILVNYGVFCTPEVLCIEREERKSKSGGLLIWTVLKVDITFYAEDGSSVTAVVMGEAMDTSDKGCNKAHSAAYKICFLEVFCIPTEEKGKDTEDEDHEPTGVDVAKEVFEGAEEVDKDRISTQDGWPSLDGNPKKISEKQGKMLYAIAKKGGMVGDGLKEAIKGKWNIEHIADITMGQFNDILEWVQGGCKDE